MKKATLFSSEQLSRRCGVGWCGAALVAGAVICGAESRAGTLVEDPKDIGDSSGDIRSIGAEVRGDLLVLTMTVDGTAGPSVENTPEGMNNRYYYHWLLDTDNNPATGRSNAEYETLPTGVENPVGADIIVQVGWRDGKPNGIQVYYPEDDDNPFLFNFTYQVSGNSITAEIPLAELGLTEGQTIALSAFQEGASESWTVDWIESAEVVLEGPDMPTLAVSDPADMGDPSGDIRAIGAQVLGEFLELSITVEGLAGPSMTNTAEGMVNRYYYHWLIDTDNNPATGRSNAEYETLPTGVENPIGADRTVMIGWRNGKREGIEVYEGTDDNITYLENFPVRSSGNSLKALVPLSALGVARGQTVSISAYQEGASEGWKVDWMESAELVLEGPDMPVLAVTDPTDMGDSSGDIRSIGAYVWGDELLLSMTVEGVAGPSVENTVEGMVNRYYYHWLIDTDNNPATGRSNAEYETLPTGVENPIGADRTVMIGWRDGKREGIEVYEGTDDNVLYLANFPVHASGNTLFARVPLSALGVALGQTVSISAYQEGASEGWKVDWMESDEMVLEAASDDGGPRLSIASDFQGDAFGFEITLTDDAEGVADEGSIELALDGEAITGDVSKSGGVTTITGEHGALLAGGSVHELLLTVDVSGETQSRRFVFTVDPYTVLPTSGRLASLDEGNTGFLVFPTLITSTTTFMDSVHSNRAELAEKQLRGEFIDPNTSEPYLNEVYFFPEEGTPWKGPGVVDEDVINWFENPAVYQPLLNFPDDELFPDIWQNPIDGAVVEILTFLKLERGQHKLGLYSEGGHKVTAGMSGSAPVVSLVDNSGEIERVPSYFARNQFFDVVAPEDGYYPFRILWFQSASREEPGMMLEFFSVENKELHLVNDRDNPLAIEAYWAEILRNPPADAPTVTLSASEGGITVDYTGTLEAAPTVEGPWDEIGEPGESPMTLPTEGEARFLRSKN